MTDMSNEVFDPAEVFDGDESEIFDGVPDVLDRSKGGVQDDVALDGDLDEEIEA